MDNPTSQQSVFNNPGGQSNLPNATAVLVLGIISIVGCLCYGLVGLICGVIALILAKKDLMLFNTSPGQYSASSYNNLKAGRICAIIGIILSALYVLLIIIMFAIYGSVMTNPMFWQQMQNHR